LRFNYQLGNAGVAKDDRLRIPIDKPYLDAVGLAVISFARLEWMAVYVVQRIGENGHNPATNPKYVGTVSAKTAGQIANDLLLAADGITDVALRNTVKLTAEKFKELTKRRNDLSTPTLAHPRIMISACSVTETSGRFRTSTTSRTSSLSAMES